MFGIFLNQGQIPFSSPFSKLQQKMAKSENKGKLFMKLNGG
jgi:hypothetical protein